MKNTHRIKAPTGKELTAKSWQTEAVMRLLMNNLDADVAEDPEHLIVYGGIGKAARNWEAYEKIVETLKRLEDDETLLVQSGKPVGVFKTHIEAPRVMIANSNLVPHWATWEEFNKLDQKGLMMYGQMTAGSWLYIGSQGIVQGTYETFSTIANTAFGGDATGKLVVTSGLGGMGGAQPLAATMAGFNIIIAEVQASKIDFRLRSGYLDTQAANLDEALVKIEAANQVGKPLSVAIQTSANMLLEELNQRGIVPDVLTDQTSAHDPANGYMPNHWTIDEWQAKREKSPEMTAAAAKASMRTHVEHFNAFQQKGSIVFEYGNNLRAMATEAGAKDAYAFPGFVEAYVRPLFCEGKGPFRWVALSGDPDDIQKTDDKVRELLPDDKMLHNWLSKAEKHVKFQGLPARICWVGLGDRDRIAVAFNEMVRSGELAAPIVIGRDHMDSGSVASPYRETEGMKDGSDAVSDWPILNAMLNCANGATWVSFHHGGGMGMGYSQHSGIAVVADGTELADKRLKRCFWNDPATGVMRHADAGYDIAKDCATQKKLDLPSV